MIARTTVPRPPILDALRRETRSAHDRLDAGLDMLGPHLSGAEYRRVLERFWGFCAPAEDRLARSRAWQGLGLDGAPRAKRPRLDADLRHLGHDDASLADLPRCDRLPRLDSVARGAGYLYVFEGATLGGALIARHLDRTLGYTRTGGAAFFGSYGDEVGPMWKQFTGALDRYAEQAAAEAEIVDAACETFSLLEQWLLTPHA